MDILINTWAWLPKKTKDIDGLSIEQVYNIKTLLTVIPKATSEFSDEKDTGPIHCFYETATHLGIPRSYFHEKRNGTQHNITEDYCYGELMSPLKTTWKATGVFEPQKESVSKMVQSLSSSPCGSLLDAEAGTGKTICAIEIARQLGRKTIVVVHKDFLVDQWRKRIKQSLPDAKVGIVKQDVCDYKGKDFVIALVQSLNARNYGDEFYRSFGTIVFDEIHRFGSRSFSQAITMFPAKWRCGVSATLRRKDACENIFLWNIGLVAHYATSKSMPFKVKVVKTGWTCKSDTIKPIALSRMAVDETRNRTIVDEILKALNAGRKVLVMGERLNMLEGIKLQIEKARPETTIGIYCGEWFESSDDRPEKYKKKTKKNPGRKMRKVTQQEKDNAESCNLILATRQTVEEGFDVVDLDTLALVTPISDCEQAVGRIRRWIAEGDTRTKKDPIVIDFVDEIAFAKTSFSYRKKFYLENGAIKPDVQTKIRSGV